MMSNIKVPTVLYIYFPYIAHLIQHLVLCFPHAVYSTRKQRAYLRFSERTPSTSFFFSIAGNIHQFKLL